MGAAELDDFLARDADEVVMFPITGGLEMAVVLLQVCGFNEALLAQQIQRAVHRGETDAVAALTRYLKDLIRTQVAGLLANDLQNGLALPGKAAARRSEKSLCIRGCKLRTGCSQWLSPLSQEHTLHFTCSRGQVI